MFAGFFYPPFAVFGAGPCKVINKAHDPPAAFRAEKATFREKGVFLFPF